MTISRLQRSQHGLAQEATDVLVENWRDGYTVPHGALYPFQWLWDSGFIALGWAHVDLGRAEAELRSLLGSQWTNGFVPHIVFHRDDAGYFPGPDQWQTSRLPHAPPGAETSGITQPPVIGFVLQSTLERVDRPADWLTVVEDLFPHVVAFHRYLYASRDPLGEGLVYIQHPWESGADNSPLWDDALAAVEVGESVRDVGARRRDVTHVAAAQRPSTEEYEKYVHLVHLARDCRYDDRCIQERSPFLVQDPLFNAILIRSNRSLARLGRRLGVDVTEIEAWTAKGVSAMNRKLWNANAACYEPFDLRSATRIGARSTLGVLGPLFAGIPDQAQADRMIRTLEDSMAGADAYWCPTVPPGASEFEPRRYWRGPVWINTNWMLYHGLRRYGRADLAQAVMNDTLELVTRHGFHEYFSPLRDRSEGLGARRFSWSAALVLDLLWTEDGGQPAAPSVDPPVSESATE